MINLSQRKYVNLNNFCLYIMVITTMLGPLVYLGVASLYHFVYVALVLLVAYKGINTRDYKTPIIMFLAVWLIESAVSVLWAPDKMLALQYVYYIFLILCSCILFHYFLFRENFEAFSHAMVLILLLCNLVAFWEVKTGNHLFPDYLSTPVRMRVLKYVPCAFFWNPNGLATYIIQIIPFSFVCINSPKRWVRIISWFNLIASFFSICAAQSRTQIILIIVMYLFFAIISRKKTIIKFGVFAIAVGMLLYFVYPDFNKLIDDAMKSVTGDSIVSSLNGEGESLNTRVNLMKNAGYILLDTFGFGIGAGCHRAVMAQYSALYFDTYGILVMHNLLGELLVDYGIVMAIAFLTTIVVSCRSLHRIYKSDAEENIRLFAVMLELSLALMIICGLSSSSLLQSTSMWFTFCFTSAFVNLYKVK